MLVFIVGLLVLGFIGFTVIAFIAVFSSDRSKKKNESKSESILDQTFDGSNAVSYQITLTSLGYDAVVLGGMARGYSLESSSGADRYGHQTLIFTKDD